MLDECGAPYETVHTDFGKREHKTPEFMKINPAGKLPALVDGEARLFENAAIGLYLAEKISWCRARACAGLAGAWAFSVAEGVFHVPAGTFHGG